MCDISLRGATGGPLRSRLGSVLSTPRALNAVCLLSIFCVLIPVGGCAASGAQVKDPDQAVACRAADGEGVILIRCGRFAMAIVDIDPTLDDDAVVKVYRSVVDDEVGVAVLVEEAPLTLGGRTWAGFSWETPDRVAPRSGRVLTGEFEGQRRVLTCEVRDAGRTAAARCEERLTELLTKGHKGLPRVSVAELAKGAPAAGGEPGADEGDR